MKKPEVMIPADQIRRQIKLIADRITADYRSEFPDIQEITVIGALNGCFIFMADLIRCMDILVRTEFIEVSSYGNQKESSGIVRIQEKDLTNLRDRHVLIAEDIIDTGITLHALQQRILSENPASLKTAALLRKQSRHLTGTEAEYICFDIDDHFVVGYGLDAAGLWRNLDYIGIAE